MEANNVNQKVKISRALKCQKKKKKKNLYCFYKIMETKSFDDQNHKDQGKKELQ